MKHPVLKRSLRHCAVLALTFAFACSSKDKRKDDDDDGTIKLSSAKSATSAAASSPVTSAPPTVAQPSAPAPSPSSTEDPYRPTAEPTIPASVAQGRVDPKEVTRAPGGRAVKRSATEVDLASSLSFTPDTDPYCKSNADITDALKQLGYDIDKELRRVSSLSDAEEEKIGDEAFQEVLKAKQFQGKVDTSAMADYRRYIAELAVPLLASVERKGVVYDFHTIDDPTVNAFAIPGGHIFFYRGILEKPRRLENEAQLAGVLAHEINHVDRRHTIAIFEYLKNLGGLAGPAGDIGAVVVNMARHPFSTTQEDESDTFAVKFLIAAEYSPKQFAQMWRNWDQLDGREKPSNPLEAGLEAILATHSAPARRACNAMRVTMSSKSPDIERYYVGTTNFKEKKPRARQQY